MRHVLSPSAVSAILLNYQNGPDTIACLHAIQAMPNKPRRIIVVDNNSPDDSIKQIMAGWGTSPFPVLLSEEKAPEQKTSAVPHIVLALSANNGFSAGNNAGTRLALHDPACRAVWILNNDTEPASDALDRLCERLNQKPKAGVAGSTLVYSHAPDRVQCAGGGGFNNYLGVANALHGNEVLRDVLKIAPETVERNLGYISGASMLIRREVFEQSGFFDEDFFLYGEDTDFCIRARKAGYTLTWAPGSVVCHKEGGTTGANDTAGTRRFVRPDWVDYLGLRNRIYLVRKHYPFALPVALAGYAGVIFNRFIRGQANRIPLIFRALWDGLVGRMGKPEAFFHD
ncbi:MAG: glycosyltransferase family 2 protein [Desulfovibrio sp.]|nr:glycosyltransferase family 2 protein [Desulfovibrio sp.]